MRRIFSEPEVPKKRFWRRQFEQVPTRGQYLFDGAFGVIAPVLCFVADPVVFKGVILGTPWLEKYQLLAYLMSAVAMAVFIVWRTCRTQVATFSAPFAGVFIAGGMLSASIGIAILPLTLFGLLFVLGIFGFVPFLTAFVYFRSGVRAIRDQVNNSTFEYRFMTAGLAGLLVIAFSVWGSIYLQPLMSRPDSARAWDETWDGD
jgi:hypothetical protein